MKVRPSTPRPAYIQKVAGCPILEAEREREGEREREREGERERGRG